MTAKEKRAAVVAAYKIILGRNLYSQDATKRECCYSKYTDGKYYSDCSSSIRLAYKRAAIGLNNIGGNTVGMYQNKAAKTVACAIKSGVPTDISALRVGDLLLFAGNDKGRAYADFVGHVEFIYAISGNKVTLAGHGSGNPKTKEMVAYCKTRQNTSAATSRGNRGLLKVVRLIPDDAASGDSGSTTSPTTPSTPSGTGSGTNAMIVNCNSCNIRTGPGTQYDIHSTVKAGAAFTALDAKDWTPIRINGKVLWVSTKYAQVSASVSSGTTVKIVNCNSCNIRTGPGTEYSVHATVTPGKTFEAVLPSGWTPIKSGSKVLWVSSKYVEVQK